MLGKLFKPIFFPTGFAVYLFPGGYILVISATPKEEAEDAQHCQKVNQKAHSHQQLNFYYDHDQSAVTGLHSFPSLHLIRLFFCCAGSCALRRRCPPCRPRSPLPQCWRLTSPSLMWPTPTSPLRCSTCSKMSGRLIVCVIVLCAFYKTQSSKGPNMSVHYRVDLND